MRRMAWGMVAGVVWLAAPAHAQTVSVARGESLVVALDEKRDDGTALVVRRDDARLNEFEKAVADEFEAGKHATAIGKNYDIMREEDYPPAPAPAPHVLRITFAPVGAKGSFLVIENGYDRALVYHATMHAGDKSAPTDVCLVKPGRRGFEHWPYRIDRIDLSRITLEHWSDGDPVPCA